MTWATVFSPQDKIRKTKLLIYQKILQTGSAKTHVYRTVNYCHNSFPQLSCDITVDRCCKIITGCNRRFFCFLFFNQGDKLEWLKTHTLQCLRVLPCISTVYCTLLFKSLKSNKCCSFEISINQRTLKIFTTVSTNILSSTSVFNIDNMKYLLSCKSGY